jgi:hypothetical protein
MKRTAIVLALSAAASLAHADGADWRFYGVTKMDDRDVGLFYSNQDIRRLDNGNIKFWVKGLSQSELDKRVRDPDFSKGPGIDRAKKRVLNGYSPRFAVENNFTQDELVAVAALEEIANEAQIEPTMRVLFELNCGERVVRQLSAGGKGWSDDVPGVWKQVAPETTAAVLMAWVCPANTYPLDSLLRRDPK